MGSTCETCNLHNLVKSPICFKYSKKPSFIDLILINCLKLFMNTQTVATGLSDLNKLTLTGVKIHYEKPSPKIVTYRDYKIFSNESFRSDVINKIGRYLMFLALLNKHAPTKKRYIRANQKNFMDKELNQAIMVRSKLRNKILKLKTEESRLVYNRQRNYCIKLLRQKKKVYFKNLNINSIIDNKLFWKTICPVFSEKHNSKKSKITLREETKL